IYMNIGLGIAIISASCVLIYIGRKILSPFHKMNDYSVELARGNLSAPVKEDKNKFFGKFLWGINMLRDNLESNKERELELQKDKKTLILSLSHDIKTPLSAIKLYSRALNENIYETEEERKNAVSGIAHNAEEIEKYVSDIVAASKEDFLNLDVEMKEFYITEVMDRIRTLYSEKFKSLRTDFTIGECSNVLLSGDPVRLEEVIQNLLENAIKYGSGRYVRIEFSDEEDCRLITVRNSGCSVKEEEIPHLFESFYRGSNSENVKGSGLGLFIARSLMRMMNGEIFAKIVPSDEGSDKENAGDFAITVVVRKA
ncbi:MAG: HAMP domain-containing histidine kinase, partial [Clostridiales bacterium]|nr:HAMP domain-containing histidine kinase [Clostridiales bacterium]